MRVSHSLLLCAAFVAGCASSVSPRTTFVRPESVEGYPGVLVRRPPSSSGPIDGEAAGLAVARRHREMGACYEAAGGAQAGSGIVYALLDVDGLGSVRRATIGHTDVRHPLFERCLVSTLLAVPMPAAGASSVLQVHLVFGADDGDEGRMMLSSYRAQQSRGGAPVTIAGLRGRIQPCYERALRHRPGLRARTELQLTVEEDGSVSDAAFSSGDEVGEGLGRCVLGVVRNLTLLRDDPSVVTLSYPVILDSGRR